MLSETAKMLLALGLPFCLAVAMLYAVLRAPTPAKKSTRRRNVPAGAATAAMIAERADAQRYLRDE